MRAFALLIALAAVGLVVAGCGNLLGSGTGLSCVVQKDGIPSCFGPGGTPSAVALPKGYGAAEIAVGMGAPNGQTAVCVAAGKSGSSAGGALCWGDDTYGQLGRGTAGAASATPVRIPLGAGRATTTVGVGGTTACAVTSDGIICWGDNTNGQLGTTAPGIAGPAIVPGTASFTDTKGLTSSPTLLAMGRAHACGGTSSILVCWGAGGAGQLGSGTTADSAATVQVTFPAKIDGVSAVAAGGDSTCAITSGKEFGADRLWCWGPLVASSTPVEVTTPPGYEPRTVSVGFDHACATVSGGAVLCWGGNASGQLGPGATGAASATPVEVPGIDANLVAAGVGQSCAALRSGRLQCWGTGSAAPTAVPGITGLRSPIARPARVTGRPTVGSTLTAVTAPWPYAVDYRYQWQRRDASRTWQDIRGADKRTLKLRPALAGVAVRVSITGINAWTEAGATLASTRSSGPHAVSG